MESPLFEFQQEDVRRIVWEMKGRALIASEVGTGKTLTALTAATVLGIDRVLVVCPAGLRLNWKAEIDKWFPEFSSRVCVLLTGADPIDGTIVITSYELAAKRLAELALFAPQVVIVDEAHALKSVTALRTKLLAPFCRRARCCLLLTGTPMLNRPIELWPLLYALRVHGVGRYTDFGVKFAAGVKVRVARGRQAWDFSGASNLDELNTLLRPHMIRRRKADVIDQLPEKRRVKLAVETGQVDDRTLREQCRAALATHGTPAKAVAAAKARAESELSLDGVLAAYRAVGRAKTKAAGQWIADNASRESPLVVYAHHLDTLRDLVADATKARLRTGLIVGAVPVEERHALVTRFQAGEIDVLLCGISAANSGLTLTRASEMLVVELPWSPLIATQCEGRVHRIGSTRGVTIRYCVSEAAIDRVMWSVLTRKSETVGLAIDGDRRADRFTADAEEGEDWWLVMRRLLEEEAAGMAACAA